MESISRRGGTPLVVAEGKKVLGVIHLKDIVKGGIQERFAELRRMGIKTVMITGDNPLTAAAIAAEAGVDDFLAQATPETKLKLIRESQAGGRLVAMAGDGTNDAPALAQADVAVAMNTGTQAAKEAGNMVDLDSNPTKLIEVVKIGKQLLMTRGSLTTFSIANDVAKYFAIIPAAFALTYPELNALNIMHLATPQSAILSAVIFNAVIIVFLVPLALKGVQYRPASASKLLAGQFPDLRGGGADRALRGHQADRHDFGGVGASLTYLIKGGFYDQGIRGSNQDFVHVHGGVHGALRFSLSGARDPARANAFSPSGGGEPSGRERKDRGVRTDRSTLR